MCPIVQKPLFRCKLFLLTSKLAHIAFYREFCAITALVLFPAPFPAEGEAADRHNGADPAHKGCGARAGQPAVPENEEDSLPGHTEWTQHRDH